MKKYRALLNQVGTNPPVATVLENTIGPIVWSREEPGFYLGTLAGAFPEHKTFMVLNPIVNIGNGTSSALQFAGPDSVSVNTQDGSINADGILVEQAIEIVVYP
jgi:hypothetical protein